MTIEKVKAPKILGEIYADKYEVLQAMLEKTLPSYDRAGKKIGGMTIEESCREVGISIPYWYALLERDSSYRKLWDDAKAKRKEILIDKAMTNVEDAIYGREKLRPIDKINVSMRYLEKNSPEFKDKVEVELT